MKKIIVSFLCAVMTLSLIACAAENNEANGSNNSIVTEDKDDSINGNSDDQSSADENSAVENDESDVSQDGFINVSIENGFVNIIINHEDMAILDKENTEVWIRFYDSEDRLFGVEITAMKENFVVVPIPFEGGEPLADGYNENSYLAGTCLSFDFSNDEVAELIGASDNYEIIIRDWNEESTPEMIMDGKSDNIDGIHIYKVTYLNPDTEIVEDNMLEEESEDEEGSEDEGTSALPFVGVKYYGDGPTWGASEFVLRGADENGLPTRIVISNSGDAVSGLELDGTFSIKITDYFESDNILMGRFVGVEHDTVKGEFVSANGDRLILQID